MFETLDQLELGYDVPALPGMHLHDVITPCLVVDLDALERNLRKMGDFARLHGVALRPHGKMHKSVDIARLQMDLGAVGLCCQKVSEAEAFVRGGINDILVTNQVRGPAMIARLARLPHLGARVAVCVDDPENVVELSAAAAREGTPLGCLVEIDCGAGRCGVKTPSAAVEIARAIEAAAHLTLEGVQSYQGALQHVESYADRQAGFVSVRAITQSTVEALVDAGLPPRKVTGAGTGSHSLEALSGIYTELQCGSYAFMDADYGRIRDADGNRLDAGEWQNALFILTSIMSRTTPTRSICDAGLKVQSVDSGLPVVFGRDDVTYVSCNDEHGIIDDPSQVLRAGDHLKLVPGHCDPTCNIHDWYVGVRGSVVECLWPVSARGKFF